MNLTSAQIIELRLRAAAMAEAALGIGKTQDVDLTRLHLIAVAREMKGIDEVLRKAAEKPR